MDRGCQRRSVSLILGVILALISCGSDVSAEDGTYIDPQLGFRLDWDPAAFFQASVYGGGLMLVHGRQQLLAAPDAHNSAAECVLANLKGTLLDAPLSYARAFAVDPEPMAANIGARFSVIYAWPDGLDRYAWFACVPITSDLGSGFMALQLWARAAEWTIATTAFQPILDTIVIPNSVTTPVAGTPARL